MEAFDWEPNNTRLLSIQQLQRFVLLEQLRIHELQRKVYNEQRIIMKDQREMNTEKEQSLSFDQY